MKKVIVKLDLHDDKAKQKALKCVSSIPGIDSIAMDMKERKLTVVGAVDPVSVVSKLRKLWQAEMVSVGPAKEPEKPKEEPKKEEPKKEDQEKKEEAEAKKEEPKKEEPKKEEGEKKKEEPGPEPEKRIVVVDPQEHFYQEMIKAYKAYNPQMVTHYYVQSAEENPNACVIV